MPAFIIIPTSNADSKKALWLIKEDSDWLCNKLVQDMPKCCYYTKMSKRVSEQSHPSIFVYANRPVHFVPIKLFSELTLGLHVGLWI